MKKLLMILIAVTCISSISCNDCKNGLVGHFASGGCGDGGGSGGDCDLKGSRWRYSFTASGYAQGWTLVFFETKFEQYWGPSTNYYQNLDVTANWSCTGSTVTLYDQGNSNTAQISGDIMMLDGYPYKKL